MGSIFSSQFCLPVVETSVESRWPILESFQSYLWFGFIFFFYGQCNWDSPLGYSRFTAFWIRLSGDSKQLMPKLSWFSPYTYSSLWNKTVSLNVFHWIDYCFLSFCPYAWLLCWMLSHVEDVLFTETLDQGKPATGSKDFSSCRRNS